MHLPLLPYRQLGRVGGMRVVYKEIHSQGQGALKSQVRPGAFVRLPLIGANRNPSKLAQVQLWLCRKMQEGLMGIQRKQNSAPQEGQGEYLALTGRRLQRDSSNCLLCVLG